VKPQHRDDTFTEESAVILATTTVEDFDPFMTIFSTIGAEKGKEPQALTLGGRCSA
jgi:hypothetical protein